LIDQLNLIPFKEKRIKNVAFFICGEQRSTSMKKEESKIGMAGPIEWLPRRKLMDGWSDCGGIKWEEIRQRLFLRVSLL
jgi:hypothetical protein